MKLLCTPFSPFSRKVIVVAHEKGLIDRIETELTEVGTHVPLATEIHDRLSNSTPLMKIPVLIDDDLILFDSRVIAEYIDDLSEEPRIIPQGGSARWRALKQQAIADGIMDAAILCRFELTRAPSPWPEWQSAQTRRIVQGIDALQASFSGSHDVPEIGAISAGCALAYLDFRFRDLNWRAGRPALADWFAVLEERPSMRLTRPDAA